MDTEGVRLIDLLAQRIKSLCLLGTHIPEILRWCVKITYCTWFTFTIMLAESRCGDVPQTVAQVAGGNGGGSTQLNRAAEYLIK